jgi:hypothetical protein
MSEKALVKIVVAHKLVVELDPNEHPPEEFHNAIHDKVNELTDADAIRDWFNEKDVEVPSFSVSIEMKGVDPVELLMEELADKIVNNPNTPNKMKELVGRVQAGEDLEDVRKDIGMVLATSPEDLKEQLTEEGLPEHMIEEIVEEATEEKRKVLH